MYGLRWFPATILIGPLRMLTEWFGAATSEAGPNVRRVMTGRFEETLLRTLLVPPSRKLLGATLLWRLALCRVISVKLVLTLMFPIVPTSTSVRVSLVLR